MTLYTETSELSPSPPQALERDILSPTPSPEITEKLQKLGILLSPEALGSIQRANQWENLKKDISALEANPGEKNRFEQLYLNGYGQTVDTPFGKLSFAEIQGHEKKDEIIAGLKPSKQARYNEWEEQTANQNIQAKLQVEQTANQTEKTIDTRIQAKDQNNQVKFGLEGKKNQEILDLQTNLDYIINEIQSINGVPKPDINTIREQAEKNPPKELQGIDPVDIKSGKYDNILLADHYISDAINISKNLDSADRERFMRSITSMSDMMERERIKDFRELTNEIVLGPNREKVEQLGTNIINSGYSKDVVWNPRDRSITFRNAQGDTLVIETAKMPPQLTKSLGKLSISRDIVPLSKEDQEKLNKRNLAEKQLKTSQDTLFQSRNEFWQVRRDEYSLQGETKTDGTPSTNLYSQFLGENRWNHTQYETLEQAYAQGIIDEKDRISSLQKMQSISEEMRKNNATKILDGSISPSDREKITNMLEKRISHLESLKRSEESLARVDKKALEYIPVGGTQQWEKDASSSLSTLSELGLNHLGQQGFEDIMEAWNLTNKSSKEYQIDLSKDPKIDDIQKRKFTDAIDTFTKGNYNRNIAFVNLSKNLTNNDFINSHWNRPEKRALYLFGGENQKNPLS